MLKYLNPKTEEWFNVNRVIDNNDKYTIILDIDGEAKIHNHHIDKKLVIVMRDYSLCDNVYNKRLPVIHSNNIDFNMISNGVVDFTKVQKFLFINLEVIDGYKCLVTEINKEDLNTEYEIRPVCFRNVLDMYKLENKTDSKDIVKIMYDNVNRVIALAYVTPDDDEVTLPNINVEIKYSSLDVVANDYEIIPLRENHSRVVYDNHDEN